MEWLLSPSHNAGIFIMDLSNLREGTLNFVSLEGKMNVSATHFIGYCVPFSDYK